MTYHKFVIPLLLLIAHNGLCAGQDGGNTSPVKATAQKAQSQEASVASTQLVYLNYTPFDWEGYVEWTPQQMRGFLHKAIKNGIDKSQSGITYKSAVRVTLPADREALAKLLVNRHDVAPATGLVYARLMYEANAGETQVFVDSIGRVLQGTHQWRLSPQEFAQLKQMLGQIYHEKPLTAP